MKTLYLALIITTLYNCNAQNKKTVNTVKQDTTMKTFDIETFNKNRNSLNEYNFSKNDSVNVNQRENVQNFIEIIKVRDNHFEDFFAYYKSGTLKASVKRFPNSFTKGILKEYNEQGELIKEEDLDKPYTFSWEDIKKFLQEHDVEDLDKQVLSIRRYNEPEITEYIRKGPYWELDFKGVYKGIKGQFFIELDGITGEELLVKKFKRKGAFGGDATIAMYDTLYVKKE